MPDKAQSGYSKYVKVLNAAVDVEVDIRRGAKAIDFVRKP